MERRIVFFVLMITFFGCTLKAQKKWYSVEVACTKHGHALMGRRDIANYVDQYMPDSASNAPGRNVPNEDSVVAIAEPFLFKIYGRDIIEKERPYEIYSVDGYWVLTGTMPADTNQKGGTATIIIDPKNGAIVKYWHGK